MTKYKTRGEARPPSAAHGGVAERCVPTNASTSDLKHDVTWSALRTNAEMPLGALQRSGTLALLHLDCCSGRQLCASFNRRVGTI